MIRDDCGIPTHILMIMVNVVPAAQLAREVLRFSVFGL